MTRIFALLFAIALTLSCSTLNPILKPIGNCAGKTVAASDANEALNDLLTQNWTDLAAEGVRIGFDMLDCIISDITTQAPGLKPAATEFKTLHAVEFRAAGVSACNDSRSPKALQAPAVPGTTASGNLTLASCDRACGGRGTSIAPPSGCSCWRPSKTDWRASRWVPLRAAPGLGLVAAR